MGTRYVNSTFKGDLRVAYNKFASKSRKWITTSTLASTFIHIASTADDLKESFDISAPTANDCLTKFDAFTLKHLHQQRKRMLPDKILKRIASSGCLEER